MPRAWWYEPFADAAQRRRAWQLPGTVCAFLSFMKVATHWLHEPFAVQHRDGDSELSDSVYPDALIGRTQVPGFRAFVCVVRATDHICAGTCVASAPVHAHLCAGTCTSAPRLALQPSEPRLGSYPRRDGVALRMSDGGATCTECCSCTAQLVHSLHSCDPARCAGKVPALREQAVPKAVAKWGVCGCSTETPSSAAPSSLSPATLSPTSPTPTTLPPSYASPISAVLVCEATQLEMRAVT